jgi:two-component system chemotaxis response regulator CheY
MVSLNINILLVDDSKTMLRVLRNLLLQLGFGMIDEATDGAMAFDMIEKKKYDLVISDWNMEPMSGLDLLRKIRFSQTGFRNVRFILVTAENRVENIVAAKEAGVSNYIVKPFTEEVLKTKIYTVMKDQ